MSRSTGPVSEHEAGNGCPPSRRDRLGELRLGVGGFIDGLQARFVAADLSVPPGVTSVGRPFSRVGASDEISMRISPRCLLLAAGNSATRCGDSEYAGTGKWCFRRDADPPRAN
jgi:hypothetical protein